LATERPARALSRLFRARPGRYGLLAFAVLVFTGCLLFSVHRIKQQHEVDLRDVDASLWLASRAEYELERLLSTLDRYALGRADVAHEQLLTRFEIFWSRLPLLIEGVDSTSIQAVEDGAVSRMIAEMERLEPVVMRLRPGDRPGYLSIADRLESFAAPLQDLSRAVKSTVGLNSDARRAGARGLYLEQLGYLIGILISGSLLIGLLLRETRQVRRLLAEATTARNRIWHLAHHDPLTDLPNRWLFNDRLDQALRRGQRQGEMVALHYFDLDDFKAVNDSFGHLTGDCLLVAVGQRLRTCVRDSDTLARIGGDEFAIVQSSVSGRAGALLLAERLLAALDSPLAMDGRNLRISASIGIALYPEHGDSPEQLHQAADQALYRAKAAGPAHFRIWEPSLAAVFPRVATG
jgi:diguanylate cyclase (GGDEF)-like protein